MVKDVSCLDEERCHTLVIEDQSWSRKVVSTEREVDELTNVPVDATEMKNALHPYHLRFRTLPVCARRCAKRRTHASELPKTGFSSARVTTVDMENPFRLSARPSEVTRYTCSLISVFSPELPSKSQQGGLSHVAHLNGDEEDGECGATPCD